MSGPRCHLCGQPIDINARSTFEGTFGWARRGRAGGSDIENRRGMGVFAHPLCVKREKQGVHPNQEVLA